MFDSQLLLDALTIVLIDILLAGDNAVLIALAVQSLPDRERRIGIITGAALAVVLRVILTFFAAQLLVVPLVKLIGGSAIIWIGIKLLSDQGGNDTGRQADKLWTAIWYIMLADITMSMDNILAVAGTSKGNLGLLLFGLGLSIPFVVFTSNLLSRVMSKYPAIIWIGAAILGRVGGEMIITDQWVAKTFAPSKFWIYAVQVLLAVVVVGAGWLLSRQARSTPEPSFAEGD